YANPEFTPPFELPGDLVRAGRPFVLTPVAMAVIPLGVLAALVRRRAGVAPAVPGGSSQGTLWMLVGVVLSLTPVAVVGSYAFTTPLGHAIAWLPALEVIRTSSRLGVAGMMGLGILTGVAFGEIVALLAERVRRPPLAFGASMLLAALAIGLGHRAYAITEWTLDRTPAPMPDSYPVQVPPEVPARFTPVLASSHAPLLEVPCDVVGMKFLWQARATYRAILHGHPVLNGYASYWPAAFPDRMADGGRLPAVDALERLRRATGLGLVWVHLDDVPGAQRSAWETPPGPDATHPGFAPVAREGSELLFVVLPPTGR
ncbi:MAG TPA: hypothetical protein VLV15_11035, partial [Dongiaceae bacterium]|nr:hypothetical protein [Dongiaceae bacterium]